MQKQETARFLSGFLGLNERCIQTVLFLHHLLFYLQSRSGGLSDVELSELLTTLGKTLDTRAKGVLYNHKGASPQLQPLAEWLARALLERDRIPRGPKVTDGDIRTVVNKILFAVNAHTRENSKKSYLELAERVLSKSLQDMPELELPKEMVDVPSRSGLIFPP